MTTRFCVVGSPIEHSLSPLLHKAAYSHLGLDWSYEARLVGKGELEEFSQSNAYSGLSVTMPLKSEAFELADNLDELAFSTKAVNTLLKVNHEWLGTNTDVFGLSKALSPVVDPQKALLIGSGSTTRSALKALSLNFPSVKVSIAARDQDSVSELVQFAGEIGLDAESSELSPETVLNSDLVLSLVPAGSYMEIWKSFEASQAQIFPWIFDVSYSPWPSLIAKACGEGKVISGLEMLIWQAIAQIEFFLQHTGSSRIVDREGLYQTMKEAVFSK